MPRKKRAPDATTAAGRCVFLMNKFWSRSQAQMARDTGLTRAAISNVVNGHRAPGREMLTKIGRVTRVNANWLMYGIERPLVTAGGGVSRSEMMLPIAKRLLPGPIDEHRNLLRRKGLPVLHRDYSPSRYWFPVDDDDHADGGILRGDALLIESDGSWLGNPLLLRDKWCVVLPNTDGEPLLRRIDDDEYLHVVKVDSPHASVFPDSIRRSSMGIVRFRAAPTRPDQEHARHEGKRGVGRGSTAEKSKGKRNRSNVSTAAGISAEAHAAAGDDGGKAAETEVHSDVVVGVVVLMHRRWPWG